MKIQFLGANKTVTGSRHLLKINGKKILLDCGLYQGARDNEKNFNNNFPFDPSEIDALILSHAHIDHSGNIPNLVRQGFKGPIYSTTATRDLCGYMLEDSGYIQEREAEYLNNKNIKNGLEPNIIPIYTQEDAKRAMLQFRSVNYHIKFELFDGIHATFIDAGHILGSAITVMDIQDKEYLQKVVLTYTGDLGRKYLPILRDPEIPEFSDVLITESTYGNKLHEDMRLADDMVTEIVNETIKKGGKIIIPAFAVERSQEVVYTLHRLINQGKIPKIPVFVDSPLAINATEVFKKHPECFDSEAGKMFLENKDGILGFDLLRYVKDVEESKSLNNKIGPMIVISASGMCEHGRILHHLKNSIEDSRNTVMIVGYQAEDTLGRKLVEGAKSVNIFGKPYRVRAKVKVANFFSAHADKDGLTEFASKIQGLKKIFIVHGDEERSSGLKDELIIKGYNGEINIPSFSEEFDINFQKETKIINLSLTLDATSTNNTVH